MALSRLILLLAFSLATFAWVPRPFDQDRSKTRTYGVLGKWRAEDPGILMNPEMITRMDKPLEEHQVPLFYDDDVAEPEGPYPKDSKEPHKSNSYSVDGSEVFTRPRLSNHFIYRRGKMPSTTEAPKRHRLNATQLRERYQWPRETLGSTTTRRPLAF